MNQPFPQVKISHLPNMLAGVIIREDQVKVNFIFCLNSTCIFLCNIHNRKNDECIFCIFKCSQRPPKGKQ